MRKIVANIFVTLDGVMQAPGGPEEDPTGDFKHGGWTVNYWDDMMGKVMDDEVMSKPFDLLLGRKTYEIFAAYWPFVKNAPSNPDNIIADRLNSARKYVVSKTLSKADWENSIIIKSDIVKKIIELKKQIGPEIQVHGSSKLIQNLLKHDLIDEFRVWIFPLIIGAGKRLFGEGTIPAGLKLLDSKTSTTGVIIATYSRSGKIKTGSFMLPNTSQVDVRKS